MPTIQSTCTHFFPEGSREALAHGSAFEITGKPLEVTDEVATMIAPMYDDIVVVGASGPVAPEPTSTTENEGKE